MQNEKIKITNSNLNKPKPIGASRYATQNKQPHVGAGPVSAQNAITLVALVITIIILLILAGVTINLTLGNNGIFNTVQKVAKNYTDAQNKELADLSNFEATANDIIDKQNWSETYTTTAKYNYTDSEGNKATVPAGFQVSLKAGETKVKEGLVIRNAKDKNEFVWIPVEGMEYTYDRYDFGKLTNGTYSDYRETMPADEQTSVTTYGGYYIGRYEAGITSTTGRSDIDKDIRKTAEEIEKTWGKALSQRGKHTYNYITRNQARELCKRIYTNTNDNVTSKLCSSYAWDTALRFIEIKHPQYPINSTEGNYNSTLKETGQTTAVNSIYDMGGNVWEWTTEENSNIADSSYVERGGGYKGNPLERPASIRNYNGTDNGYEDVGFRIALFM